MDIWATLDEIRIDIQKRSKQIQGLLERARETGRKLDALADEVEDLEKSARRRRGRGRRRRGRGRPKGPTVVDVAVDILEERGGPLPCVELARAVRARGVDSGNNERSLRMSAGKGRRLRGLPDDHIALATPMR